MAVVLSLAACSGGGSPLPEPAAPAPVVFRPGASGAGDPYFPYSGNGGYDVAGYDLKLRYLPVADRLSGTATITATATQDLSRFHLDVAGLSVRSVTVDGLPAAGTTRDGELVVTPATGLRAGRGFTAVVRYTGRPRNTFTPGAARAWFPVNDHPSDKATYALEMTVPKGLTAVSNGVPGRRTTSGSTTTWRWSEAKPLPSHLVFATIGRYRVRSGTHRGKPVVTAVPARMSAGAPQAQALARIPEIADWLEQWFGPYPFEVYGPMVAGTDDRVDAAVIARELAHRWFGGSVSVRRWQDVWLAEGFATYAQWLWIEHDGGPGIEQTVREQYENYPWQVARALDPGAGRLFASGPDDRGAVTLHALRRRIGADRFFHLLRTWTADHAHGNATTADFVAVAERISGQRLGKFFDVWLSGRYRPTY